MPERLRRRYILVKIDSGKSPGEKDFQNAIWETIISLFGEYGASQTEISMIKYNQEMRYAILRCSYKALEIVRPSITAIKRIGGENASVHTLFVSGTLKALRRKMQNIFMHKTA